MDCENNYLVQSDAATREVICRVETLPGLGVVVWVAWPAAAVTKPDPLDVLASGDDHYL